MRYSAFAIVSMVLLTGCNDSSFDGANASTPAEATKKPAAQREELSSDATAAAPITETFPLKAERQPLDLVWVIDNSPSMTEENAIAQQNLDAFAAKVAKVADLHMAVISLDDGPNAVTLSDDLKSKHHVQLPTSVGSTNLLALLASASCAADKTSELIDGKMTICGVEAIGHDDYDGLEDGYAVHQIRGQLSKFYRPNAKKVFVLVTDDDADFVNSDNFLAMVGGKPTLFAFQGLTNDSCGIARVGESYSKLAEQTDGQTFDICATDWSEHFTRLTKAVEQIRSDTVQLKGHAKSLVSVSIDGRKLKPSAYSLDADGTVKLAAAALKQQPKQVEVVYLPN